MTFDEERKMEMKSGKLWCWGYVLPKVPGPMMFVNQETYCSLETGADYIHAGGVVFMNSTTSVRDLNDDLFRHVGRFEQVVCGLDHADYVAAAKAVSRFSLTHPNVTGAMLDDFLEEHGPSKNMTVDQLKAIRDALKSENPKLKLYVVRYSRQDQEVLLPYLDHIDAINFWVWVSTDHYWRYQYEDQIWMLKHRFGKEVMQGVFLHNYGESWDEPIPMDMLKLQLKKIGTVYRRGEIDSIIVLQNGWFCRDNHMEQLQYVRNYFEWLIGTTTVRDE